MMTRKDYKAIAELIKNCECVVPKEFVEDIAYYFAADNPRFDITRFYKACGIQSDKPI